MSKLEELIEQYCPDGVEYMKLGEVCKALPKGTLTTKELVEPNGHNYPVINSGRELYGYYTHFNNEGDAFTVAARGEYAGFITYFSGKFWAGGLCYPYRSYSPNISTKFIFYYLKTRQEYIRNTLVAEGSIPALNKGTLDLFEIPVPPLPVQEEIVRILDTFTELQAELQKRKQQYNYYLDNLLSFNDINRGGQAEVKWMKMNEVFEIRNGYTPSKAKKEFWEGGTIPWFRMEDIRQNGRILSDSILHITPQGVKGKGLFKANSFILATTATIGEHALIIADSLANQQFTNLLIRKSLENELSVKYVYYYFFVIDEWCKANTNVSNFASVDMSKFYNLLIPIPSISEQQRIVSILDRFDTLTTDLTQGLPAEIEKRKQQYEYYRDKLLTFKRKGA